MSEISRREALGMMAAAVPAALVLEKDVMWRATRAVNRALAAQAATGQAYAPEFFTPEEWRDLRVLVDLIIPRDEQSGSATDAGVPEFIDFVMIDRPQMQDAMRSGLAWLDGESRRRYDQAFAECETAQQTTILDDVAWPARASEEMADGVHFFNVVRDHTASAFWSSKIGVEDIGYQGNVAVAEWRGCPEDALRKIGVSYEEWEQR